MPGLTAGTFPYECRFGPSGARMTIQSKVNLSELFEREDSRPLPPSYCRSRTASGAPYPAFQPVGRSVKLIPTPHSRLHSPLTSPARSPLFATAAVVGEAARGSGDGDGRTPPARPPQQSPVLGSRCRLQAVQPQAVRPRIGQGVGPGGLMVACESWTPEVGLCATGAHSRIRARPRERGATGARARPRLTLVDTARLRSGTARADLKARGNEKPRTPENAGGAPRGRRSSCSRQAKAGRTAVPSSGRTGRTTGSSRSAAGLSLVQHA